MLGDKSNKMSFMKDIGISAIIQSRCHRSWSLDENWMYHILNSLIIIQVNSLSNTYASR